MMTKSKQIQFFMSAEDEREFVSFCFSSGEVCLVRDQWYDDVQCPLYCTPEELFAQPARDTRHQLAVWLIWRRDLRSELAFRPVTGQPFFEIRRDVNPVLEFSRCVVEREVWQLGRLAYVAGYSDEDGTPQRIERSWSRWYDSLIAWVAARGAPASFDGVTPERDLVILPGALEAFRQGARLGRLGGKPGAFRPVGDAPPT